ncbi:MAG: Hsp20/alpha crystallin family protein [Cyclobacteriaceae bacterium]
MKLVKYNQNTLPGTYGSFIDRFFNDDFYGGRTSTSFSPKVDIAETKETFEIQFHVPGISKEEINIDVKDDRLTVSGERKLEKEKQEKNFHTLESHYGSFSRSFYLPDNIKLDDIEATYKDGILSIVVPKDEKKETHKTISIK